MNKVNYWPVHPGNGVKNFMQKNGMTIREFSEKSGISKSVICRIINGKCDITPSTAIGIEKATGLTAELWMSNQIKWSLYVIRKAQDIEAGQ